MRYTDQVRLQPYLAERQSVILPLGVTEQHGYHLPTCTDSLNAREISVRAGKRLGMLVAPTINMSYSGGQLPGTINISPNVVGLLVGEVLRSLAAQGFKNIFMLLAHGGSENIRALDNTLNLLLRSDPSFSEVMLVLAPAWKLSPTWTKAFTEQDWHAGWVETSLIMAMAPELVQMENLAMDTAELVAEMCAHPDNYQYSCKPVDNEFTVPCISQRPEVQVGVMGAPREASAAKGQQILDEMVENACALFADLEKSRTREYKKVSWTPEPIIIT